MDDLFPSESYRVAVLMGGESAEREISLASGICVAEALEKAGHRVQAVDPSETELVEIDWRAFDACFIALHGGAGEDGRIQALLDSLGVLYPGSGPAASALAISKAAAKNRWIEVGVPTAPFALTHALEPIGTLTRRARTLGYPLVIKPDAQGSSLGVSLVHNEDELQVALAECQFYDPYVLAESFLAGREFTVPLLGSRVLPLVEISPEEEIFSYDSKYHTSPGESPFRFEPRLSEQEQQLLEKSAVAAAEALGTEGLVRVDLILAEPENEPPKKEWEVSPGQAFVLEVNTVPGMTEQSTAPMSAALAGLDLPRLCHLLLCDCLSRESAR